MLYRIFLVLLAVLAWFALAAQLYIIIRYHNSSFGATVVQYFSYYTILTNLMIAWVTTILFIRREGTSKRQKTAYGNPCLYHDRRINLQHYSAFIMETAGAAIACRQFTA